MTVRTPIKLTTPTKPENPQVTEPKALGKVVLQKKYGSSKNSLKLSWQPVYGADGYEMRYATSKSLTKNVRIKNFKAAKTNCKLKKLSSKKKYFVRIRAYKDTSYGRIYGPWSSRKACKTK